MANLDLNTILAGGAGAVTIAGTWLYLILTWFFGLVSDGTLWIF